MTNTWYLTFHKFQLSRENAWKPKIYQALQSQIKPVVAVLKQDGADAAIRFTHTHLPFLSVANIIKAIYIDAGRVFGAKTYQMVKQQAEKRLMPMGFNEDLINDIVQYFQLHLLNKAVVPITETTRDFILRTLTKMQEEGWSVNMATKELLSSDITQNRARMIVRTETVRSANIGAIMGAKKTGYQMRKQWISALDNRVRRLPRDAADHLHLNGQQVEMNEKFIESSVNGQILLSQPGDPEAPASSVINCRCTVGFKVKRGGDGRPLKV